jgi:hypothetical protein
MAIIDASSNAYFKSANSLFNEASDSLDASFNEFIKVVLNDVSKYPKKDKIFTVYISSIDSENLYDTIKFCMIQ